MSLTSPPRQIQTFYMQYRAIKGRRKLLHFMFDIMEMLFAEIECVCGVLRFKSMYETFRNRSCQLIIFSWNYIIGNRNFPFLIRYIQGSYNVTQNQNIPPITNSDYQCLGYSSCLSIAYLYLFIISLNLQHALIFSSLIFIYVLSGLPPAEYVYYLLTASYLLYKPYITIKLHLIRVPYFNNYDDLEMTIPKTNHFQ